MGVAEMQRSLNTDALGSLHRRRSPLADVQSSNLRAGVSSDWGRRAPLVQARLPRTLPRSRTREPVLSFFI